MNLLPLLSLCICICNILWCQEPQRKNIYNITVSKGDIIYALLEEVQSYPLNDSKWNENALTSLQTANDYNKQQAILLFNLFFDQSINELITSSLTKIYLERERLNSSFKLLNLAYGIKAESVPNDKKQLYDQLVTVLNPSNDLLSDLGYEIFINQKINQIRLEFASKVKRNANMTHSADDIINNAIANLEQLNKDMQRLNKEKEKHTGPRQSRIQSFLMSIRYNPTSEQLEPIITMMKRVRIVQEIYIHYAKKFLATKHRGAFTEQAKRLQDLTTQSWTEYVGLGAKSYITDFEKYETRT